MFKKKNRKRLFKLSLALSLSILPLTTLVACFDFDFTITRKSKEQKKDNNSAKEEPIASKDIFPNKNPKKSDASKNGQPSTNEDNIEENQDDLSPETISNSIGNHLLDYEKINSDNILNIIGLKDQDYFVELFDKGETEWELQFRNSKTFTLSERYKIPVQSDEEFINNLTKNGAKALKEKEILNFNQDIKSYTWEDFQNVEVAKKHLNFRSFNGFTFELNEKKKPYKENPNIVVLPIIATKKSKNYKFTFSFELNDKKEAYKLREFEVVPNDNFRFIQAQIDTNKPIDFKQFLIKHFGLNVELATKVNNFKQLYKTNYDLNDFKITSMLLKEDPTTNIDYLEIKMVFQSDESLSFTKLVPLAGITNDTSFDFSNIHIKQLSTIFNVKYKDITAKNYKQFFLIKTNSEDWYPTSSEEFLQTKKLKYEVLDDSFTGEEKFDSSWTKDKVDKYINSRLYANLKVKITDLVNNLSIIRELKVFPYKTKKPEIKPFDEYFQHVDKPSNKELKDAFEKNQIVAQSLTSNNFISALTANSALKSPFLNNFDQKDLNAENFEAFVAPKYYQNPEYLGVNLEDRFNSLFSQNYHRYYYDFKNINDDQISFKVGFISRVVPEFRFFSNPITFAKKFKNDFKDNFDLKQKLSSINFSNVSQTIKTHVNGFITNNSNLIIDNLLSFSNISKSDYNVHLSMTDYPESNIKFVALTPSISKANNPTYFVHADKKYIIFSGEDFSKNISDNSNTSNNTNNSETDKENQNKIKEIVNSVEKNNTDSDNVTIIFPKRGQYMRKKIDLSIEESQFIKKDSGFSFIVDKKYLDLSNLDNKYIQSSLELQFPLAIKHEGKTFTKVISIQIEPSYFNKGQLKRNLRELTSDEDPNFKIEIQTTIEQIKEEKLKITFLSPNSNKFEYTSLASQKNESNEFLVNQLWVKMFSKTWVEDPLYFQVLNTLNKFTPIEFLDTPELNNFKQARTLKNANLDKVNINSSDPIEEGNGFVPDFQQLNNEYYDPIIEDLKKRTFFSNGTLTMLAKVDPINPDDKRYYFITNRHVAMGVSKKFDITAGDSYTNSIQVLQDINHLDDAQKRFFMVDNIKFRIEWDATKQISKDLKTRDNEEDIFIGIIDVDEIIRKAEKSGAYQVVEFFEKWEELKPLHFAPTNVFYPTNTTPKTPLVKDNKIKLPGYLVGFPNARYSELEVNRVNVKLDEGKSVYRLGEDATIALSQNSFYAEIKYQGLRKLYLLQGSSGTLYVNKKGEIIGVLSAGLNEEKQYFALLRLTANPVFDYIGTSEIGIPFNRIVNVNSFYYHLFLKSISHAGYNVNFLKRLGN